MRTRTRTATRTRTRTGTSKKRKGWGRGWLLIGFLLLAGVLLSGYMLARTSDEQVAELGGYAITDQEVAFHMERLKPSVENEFRVKSQVTLGKGDWTKPVGDLPPLGVLQERALEQAVRDKVVMILARSHGLLDTVDFSGLTASMEAENRERQAAVQRGEVVYGLVRFTLESYYAHMLVSLESGLKQKLSQHPEDLLYLERGDVESYYEAHASEWAAMATQYKVAKLTVPVSQEGKKEAAGVITKLAAKNATLEEMAGRFTGAILQTELLAEESSANLNSPSYQVVSQLRGLHPGELTSPVETREGFAVYRLEEVKVDKQKALQIYDYQIRQQMLEERFEAYVEQYQSELPLQVNRAKLAEVTIPGT